MVVKNLTVTVSVKGQRRRIEVVEVDMNAEFLLDDQSRGRAYRQVDVAAGSTKNVEQTHRVGRATGSGHGHDELAFHFVPTYRVAMPKVKERKCTS